MLHERSRFNRPPPIPVSPAAIFLREYTFTAGEKLLHILHIDTGAKWRGGQQQAWWLLEGLRKQGIEQTLLVLTQSEFAKRVLTLSNDDSGPRVDVHYLKISVGKILNYENARVVRNAAGDCDLIHAHDAHAHTLVWAAQKMSRQLRPPLVVARRVTFPIRWLGRLKNRQPAWFIAVSEFVRAQLIDSGIPASRARVVHDGVRLPPVMPSELRRTIARQRFGLGPQSLALGTLSSLAPEKMLEDTVRLVATLPSDCHFLLGIPEAQANSEQAGLLRRLASELGLNSRFHIVPVGAKAPPDANSVSTSDLLWSLDMFLYLSKAEGLGSAILLAMAHGLPVVASRVGGIPEIVAHGETGMLIDTSANAWQRAARDAILALGDDPETRNRFGTLARVFVAEQATSDNMVARTLAIYREILAARAEESRLARS